MRSIYMTILPKMTKSTNFQHLEYHILKYNFIRYNKITDEGAGWIAKLLTVT